jgi:hypothetical protein
MLRAGNGNVGRFGAGVAAKAVPPAKIISENKAASATDKGARLSFIIIE